MGRVGGKAATRRRKTSTKKSPNRKCTHPSFGQPATINDLPAETLLEICNFMEPIDVLHITRTNTFLRQLVRNNDKIWRIARRNLGPDFPDCPPGISELKYAIFVFGKKCMVCGASGPLERQYALVRRACHDCIRSTLLGIHDPAYVRTNRMVFDACSHGLCGLLESIPEIIINEWSYPEWRSIMQQKNGYDCSDIVKLQRDLGPAKNLAQMRQVFCDWQFHFPVRSKLHPEIRRWMMIHEPYVDEEGIFGQRKYQIIKRLGAVKGLNKAAMRRFMMRQDRYYKRFVLQPHPLTDEGWKKIRAQLMYLIGPPLETRSKQSRKR